MDPPGLCARIPRERSTNTRTTTSRRSHGARTAEHPPPGLTVMSGEDSDEKWRRDALCSQSDPDAFFPEKGGSTADAKKVCAQCGVRAQCLDYALRADERFGVWGGLSTTERDNFIKSAAAAHRTAAQAKKQERDALIVAMAGRGMNPRIIADTAEVTDRTVYRVLARHKERQDAVSA